MGVIKTPDVPEIGIQAAPIWTTLFCPIRISLTIAIIVAAVNLLAELRRFMRSQRQREKIGTPTVAL